MQLRAAGSLVIHVCLGFSSARGFKKPEEASTLRDPCRSLFVLQLVVCVALAGNAASGGGTPRSGGPSAGVRPFGRRSIRWPTGRWASRFKLLPPGGDQFTLGPTVLCAEVSQRKQSCDVADQLRLGALAKVHKSILPVEFITSIKCNSCL